MVCPESIFGMDWQIASQTHRGNVRAINEDALLVEKRYPLMVVADGMGGHQAGEVASNMLVESLGALRLADSIYSASAQVEASIIQCNSSLVEYSREKFGGQPLGSTVVAMVADSSMGICMWAGDSRLYRARNSQLEQITGDHSYVADLVRSGQISAEEAVNHPSSNIITRAVGAAAELALDSLSFGIADRDTYLLCSDGLYNEISADDILAAMCAQDIWQSAEQLLQLCLSSRARDNVSFVMARAVAGPEEHLNATVALRP
jgi:serine/threonine protein phosphatase PrpC